MSWFSPVSLLLLLLPSKNASTADEEQYTAAVASARGREKASESWKSFFLGGRGVEREKRERERATKTKNAQRPALSHPAREPAPARVCGGAFRLLRHGSETLCARASERVRKEIGEGLSSGLQREKSERSKRKKRKTNGLLSQSFLRRFFLGEDNRSPKEKEPFLLFRLSLFCFAMSLQATTTRNTITLKGSSKIVTEFFAYAVNR